MCRQGRFTVVVGHHQELPKLEDLWQLHFSNEGGAAHNSAGPLSPTLRTGCGPLSESIGLVDGRLESTIRDTDYQALRATPKRESHDSSASGLDGP